MIWSDILRQTDQLEAVPTGEPHLVTVNPRWRSQPMGYEFKMKMAEGRVYAPLLSTLAKGHKGGLATFDEPGCIQQFLKNRRSEANLSQSQLAENAPWWATHFSRIPLRCKWLYQNKQ